MIHQYSEPVIAFIDERDGAHERRLKEAISVLLDLNASVARAYLVRAGYDVISGGVVLGLVTHDKKESGNLASQMDRAFGALFNTETHLDVVFLDAEGDERIQKTCPPFYQYRARYH